ncbi:16S rRNA (guanine(527)-N(7))-methyltransferase RsmG [Alcaligenes sp. Marseille-Q7550]
MSADFNPRLIQAMKDLGLEADPETVRQLLAYIQQLQRWNRTYNLTALRDPDQMLVQHIFDSLSVVRPFQEHLANDVAVDKSVRIVDVGSGAGLPGVVLAASCSTWNITCIDAVEKKMAFVRQMVGTLGLPNLRALHVRVEQQPPLEADIVVSRAFSSLLDFVNLAGRHVREGGRIAAMKGRVPEEEIAALQDQSAWKVERIEPLTVPELEAQRCLVWLVQQG